MAAVLNTPECQCLSRLGRRISRTKCCPHRAAIGGSTYDKPPKHCPALQLQSCGFVHSVRFQRPQSIIRSSAARSESRFGLESAEKLSNVTDVAL